MKYKLALFIFTLFLQSCSLNNVVEFAENQKKEKLKEAKEKKFNNLVCKSKGREKRLYGLHPAIDEEILKVIKTHQLNFNESIYLISYYMLYFRPDAASVNSRTLHLYKNKKGLIKTLYIPNDSKSYLTYLKDKLKDKNVRISKVSKAINSLPRRIPVSSQLQKFVQSHQTSFYNNSFLKKIFFKGNQIIKQDETYPFIKKRLNIYGYKDKKTKKIDFLFKHDNGYQCNFDENLFRDAPIFTKKNENVNSHVFAYFNSPNQFFITVTASKPIIDRDKNTYLFETSVTNSFNSAICLNESLNNFVITSNNLHSEQILYNILSSSQYNDHRLINTKRFLELQYPKRKVIEVYGEETDRSKRNKKYTIYTPTIGRVDYIEYKKNRPILYKDPRNELMICN